MKRDYHYYIRIYHIYGNIKEEIFMFCNERYSCIFLGCDTQSQRGKERKIFMIF